MNKWERLKYILRREGIISVLKDMCIYFPQGLFRNTITTPDKVHLCLTGLSPITKGRFKLGDAENAERELIKLIPRNIPIIELGAGSGYITVLMNRTTSELHIAVEPNIRIFALLEKNKRLNNSNFKIIHKAYHPHKDQIKFPDTKYYKTVSCLDENKTGVTVNCVNLKTVLNRFQPDRFLLYVDIEGAESLLFDNEMGCIVSNCIGVLVEFHPEIIGEDKKIKYVNELKKHYVLISENGNVKLFLKRNYLDSGK